MPFPVLFVCIGNVCRSPFAERLLRLRLDELGIGESYEITSAGVRALRDRPMHPESERTLTSRGGSAHGFVARQFTPAIGAGAGLILAATRDIRSALLEEYPQAIKRTFTLREFVALGEAHREAGEVEPGVRAAELPITQRDQLLHSLIADCSHGRASLRLEEYDVPDPIGRSSATFDAVAEVVDDQIVRLARILHDPM